MIFLNSVFGVIGLIPEFRKNFALNFCSLSTPLRTKNVLITPLRKKMGKLRITPQQKGLITPLRQPIIPPTTTRVKLGPVELSFVRLAYYGRGTTGGGIPSQGWQH